MAVLQSGDRISRLAFAEELLASERIEHAETVARLDATVKAQAERIALLEAAAKRNEADLTQARTKAKALQLIEKWRDGELGDAMADAVSLKLETYQDDESGRDMLVPDQGSIDAGSLVDGDWIPMWLTATKPAVDGGESARLRFTLDLSSLKYDVEVVE